MANDPPAAERVRKSKGTDHVTSYPPPLGPWMNMRIKTTTTTITTTITLIVVIIHRRRQRRRRGRRRCGRPGQLTLFACACIFFVSALCCFTLAISAWMQFLCPKQTAQHRGRDTSNQNGWDSPSRPTTRVLSSCEGRRADTSAAAQGEAFD